MSGIGLVMSGSGLETKRHAMSGIRIGPLGSSLEKSRPVRSGIGMGAIGFEPENHRNALLKVFNSPGRSDKLPI